MAGGDLESELKRLLDRPIDDEKKVLEILVGAITSKYTDPSLVRQAVKQAVFNYENQLRVFMVAVANAQLARVVRLINLIDKLEEKFSGEDVIDRMQPRDLIKLYALQQSNLVTSLDYIKKIADMRIELQQAQAAITNTLTSREISEINTLSGLPSLSAQQRSSVRMLVENIMSDIAVDAEFSESEACDCGDPNCECGGGLRESEEAHQEDPSGRSDGS